MNNINKTIANLIQDAERVGARLFPKADADLFEVAIHVESGSGKFGAVLLFVDEHGKPDRFEPKGAAKSDLSEALHQLVGQLEDAHLESLDAAE